MYTRKQIAELRAKCEALRLDNFWILDRFSDRELQKICNGIGAASFPDVLTHALDDLHPTLKPVAMIHDVEWHLSTGKKADFEESNARFADNGKIAARAAYGWYDPRRYIVTAQASKLAALCRVFGWSHYKECRYYV